MPELPTGFFEHAQWQRTGLQAKRLADLDWWGNQLQGAPLKPLLTSDYPRSGKANLNHNPGGIVKASMLACKDPLHQSTNLLPAVCCLSLVRCKMCAHMYNCWYPSFINACSHGLFASLCERSELLLGFQAFAAEQLA